MKTIQKYILTQVARQSLSKEDAKEMLKELQGSESMGKQEFAIIGISGRMPGADNLSQYWDNLRTGICSIVEFPQKRWEDSKILTLEEKKNCRKGGYLKEIDKFDCQFFGISPEEAKYMSPLQRLVLMASYEAVEDAGYGGDKLKGSHTGVYVGVETTSIPDYNKLFPKEDSLMFTGSMVGVLASRVSYQFNLKGPALVLDTACSSSLTAIITACQAMKDKLCDMAIVSGICLNLLPSPKQNVMDMVESGDDLIKAFDQSAAGTSWGEAVGTVVVKPLAKAIKDRDSVYGVIKGWGMNNDGSSNGITAPDAKAQAEVLTKAWKHAGVHPEDIQYIETHGTGTKLGDPIEIKGLTIAFEHMTHKKQFCGIGSVKTNIGHTIGAAGMCSLIKILLMLKHKKLAPSLHFNQPNQFISFIDSPVYVVDRLVEWQRGKNGRYAGISAFGFSGTNCHMVIGEAPEQKQEKEEKMRPAQVLTVSAKSQEGILNYIIGYIRYLEQNPQCFLKELCYTVNTGRGHYNYRVAVLCNTVEQLREKLLRITTDGLVHCEEYGVYYGVHQVISCESELLENEITKTRKDRISNEGNQCCKEYLAREEPKILSKICRLYIQGADINWNLFYENKLYQRLHLPVYPFDSARCWPEKSKQKSGQKNIRHPLLDCCMVESMNSAVYKTSLSVSNIWLLNEHTVDSRYILPGISYIEIAGELARQQFKEQGWIIKDLMFIWPLVVEQDTEKEVFTELQKKENCFEITVVSRQNGGWLKHAQGRLYPADSQRQPKVFNLGKLKTACSKKETTQFSHDTIGGIHVGPRWNVVESKQYGERSVLVHLKLPDRYVLDMKEFYLHPSLLDCAMNGAIQFIGYGLYLPWRYEEIVVYDKLPIECYSYIIRTDKQGAQASVATFDIFVMDKAGNVLIEVKGYSIKKTGSIQAETSGDFYQIGWVEKARESVKRQFHPNRQDCVLVLKGADEKSQRLIHAIVQTGRKVIEVTLGETYKKEGADSYTISSCEADYNRLINDVKKQNLTGIVHMVHVGQKEPAVMEEFEKLSSCGVISLFYLTKALLYNRIGQELDIVLLAEQVYEVSRTEDRLFPHAAALFGLGRVVTQEYPKLKCRAIDIDMRTDTKTILKEIEVGSTDGLVVYRSGTRYIQDMKSLDVKSLPRREIVIEENGVYLITGGLGGIGLEFAKYLSSKKKVHLVLLNRSQFPDKKNWNQIMKEGRKEKQIKKIQNLMEIEKSGTCVDLYSIDISDETALKRVLEQVRRQYGRVCGIIHAAGVAGKGFLFNKKEMTFQEVIKPKMNGTWLLDKLTRKDNPDFFAMFSSIATIYGGVGQGDYVAGNSYMDAFTSYRNRQGRKTVTINWTAWKETGMAVDNQFHQEEKFLTISTKQAIHGFETILETQTAQAIIGTLAKSSEKEMTVVAAEIKNEHPVKLAGRRTGQYTSTEQQVADIWGKVLGLTAINVYDNFEKVGGNSILAVKLLDKIQAEFPNMAEIADVFTYGTIEKFASMLLKRKESALETSKVKISEKIEISEQPFLEAERNEIRTEEEDVAVIGIACRYPEADNVEEFWQNLKHKKCSIRAIPKERRQYVEEYFKQNNMEVPEILEAGYLEEIDKFDTKFFHVTPKEAENMHPVQRLFLETSYVALEDAGYGGEAVYNTRTGVYVGVDHSVEFDYQKQYGKDDIVSFVGSYSALLANRISYLYNFRGPAIVVDTACSSGLVAVHQACQGIRDHECEMAVAGGVNLFFYRKYTALAGVESDTGEVRAFDKDANGTVWGEGIGVVLLKSLKKAKEDHDHIYAVLKGSAVNSDGASNGITAPNAQAQTELLIQAWEKAKIDPETIDYIETHGTGTVLGDPIEIKGIQDAFRHYTDKRQFCAVNSVKNNIGHTCGASGVASLIKTIISIQKKQIPANMNFDYPNPFIRFIDSPVYVNDQFLPWETEGHPRRAGVSAFGLSGTNCHVVVEEVKEVQNTLSKDRGYVLAISAQYEEGVLRLVHQYCNLLKESPLCNLRDLCITANKGRGHYSHRLIFKFSDMESLRYKISLVEECNVLFHDPGEGIYYGICETMLDKNNQEEMAEQQLGQIEHDVNQMIHQTNTYSISYDMLLSQICTAYIKGARIDWNTLYQNQSYTKMSLPTYPFEKERCWADGKNIENGQVRDGKDSFYNTIWVPKELHREAQDKRTGSILVFKEQTKECHSIVDLLKEQGLELIEVVQGETYQKHSECKYTLGPGEENYNTLFQDLQGKEIAQVVFFHGLQGTETTSLLELEEIQEKGIMGLFYVARALGKVYVGCNMELVLVSSNAFSVTGNEKHINPLSAAFFGLGKVVGQENSQIRCRAIDIDPSMKQEEILLELIHGKDIYQVAYRQGIRYIEELHQKNPEKLEEKSVVLDKEGVYVITGGLGGIGFEMGKFLVAKGAIKLSLWNRTKVPSRDEWIQVLERNEDKNTIKNIRNIQELEKRGALVSCFSLDVTDYDAVWKALEVLRNQHGPIKGVVHCAGIGNDVPLEKKRKEEFEKILNVKIKGTWILDKLTIPDHLDFFLLSSSISSLLGGIGKGDYTAGSAYLDAYSAYRTRQGRRTLCINWPVWKETGMAVEHAMNKDGIFKAIETKQALQCLDMVWNKAVNQIIIGSINNSKYQIPYIPVRNLRSIPIKYLEGDVLKKEDNVVLCGREGGLYTELEQQVGAIWGDLLGLKKIPIDRSFYELGGNSILAIQMEVAMEKRGLIITAEELKSYETVQTMAEYVENQQKQEDPKILIEPVEPFNDLFFHDCQFNTIFAAVNHFGGDIGYFLANDTILYYSHANKENRQEFGVQYKPFWNEERVYAACGISCMKKNKVQNVIEEAQKAIRSGRLVTLWIDCYYESMRKDVYQKEHLPHSILLHGYDDKKGVFNIIEHSNRDRLDYKHITITYKELVACYQGYLEHFFGVHRKKTYFEYESQDSLEKVSVFRLMEENMTQNKKELIDSVEKLRKITKWIQNVVSNEVLLRDSAESLMEKMNQIVNALKVEKYRFEHYVPDAQSMVAQLDEVTFRWERVRAWIGKYKITSRYQERTAGTIIKLLEQIADLEQDRICSILEKRNGKCNHNF